MFERVCVCVCVRERALVFMHGVCLCMFVCVILQFQFSFLCMYASMCLVKRMDTFLCFWCLPEERLYASIYTHSALAQLNCLLLATLSTPPSWCCSLQVLVMKQCNSARGRSSPTSHRHHHNISQAAAVLFNTKGLVQLVVKERKCQLRVKGGVGVVVLMLMWANWQLRSGVYAHPPAFWMFLSKRGCSSWHGTVLPVLHKMTSGQGQTRPNCLFIVAEEQHGPLGLTCCSPAYGQTWELTYTPLNTRRHTHKNTCMYGHTNLLHVSTHKILTVASSSSCPILSSCVFWSRCLVTYKMTVAGEAFVSCCPSQQLCPLQNDIKGQRACFELLFHGAFYV